MGRFGIVVLDRRLFFRLLLPGFLTSLGAGQLIPFLNVFIENKFGLGLTAVNAMFAISSLGTALAILACSRLWRGVSAASGRSCWFRGPASRSWSCSDSRRCCGR